MRPVSLTHAFLRLATPRDLAEIMRRLLQLEAGRLNLPVGTAQASLRVTVKDEGEDGVSLRVPDSRETRLPAGDTLFQFKTTTDQRAIVGDVPVEVGKARPRAMLAEGGSYILVYSKDFVGRERDDVLDALRAAVDERYRESVDVWGAGELEQLCWDNPAIALELSLAPMQGVLPFSKWSPAIIRTAPRFVPDAARDQAISEIRFRVDTSQDPVLLHLEGDAGVGKTRLIREALNEEGIRDQVVVAMSRESAIDFLNYLAAQPQAQAILLIDDVAAEDLDSIQRTAQVAAGRARIITIGLPSPRRWVRPSGPWGLSLATLDPAVIQQLLEQDLGLPSSDARWIADVSEGYPRLAIELANAYRQDQTLAGTLSSAVGLRGIDSLLARMIPTGDARKHLEVAALFAAIGVEDDRRVEVEAVAKAFDLDPVLMVDALRNDTGRFVSAAGRYRSITPKLVAVWLMIAAFRTYGRAIVEKVNSLDESLRAQFTQQLELVADSPIAVDVVAELIGAEEFRKPADFDAAVARFLQSAAAIVPKQVAEILRTVISEKTPTGLKSEWFPRREVVWTLEQLLWPEETVEAALALLLRLAENESESFANNATGVFIDSFQMHLGGTTAPYSQRLAWLRAQLEHSRAHPGRTTLVAKALAAGLRSYQTRTHGSRAGTYGIRDWRPASFEEEVDLRREIWSTLVGILEDGPCQERPSVVSAIAKSLRMAATRGILTEVLHGLDRSDWSADERAELAAQLRDILRFDKPEEPYRTKVLERLSDLMGHDFRSRAATVFSSSLWDLADDTTEPGQLPAALEDLVSGASKDPILLADALDVARETVDQNTAYGFFRAWALRNDPAELVRLSLAQDQPVLSAYQAAISAADERGQQEWVDAELARSLDDPLRQRRLVQLIRSVALTDTRAQLALQAQRSGLVQAAEFTQFLYGAPIRGLSISSAVDVISVAAEPDDVNALEHALGMLDQYAEEVREARDDDRTRALVVDLAERAAGKPHLTPTGAHTLARTVKLFRLEPLVALSILGRRLTTTESFLAPDDAQLLNDLFRSAPGETGELVLEILEKAISPPYQTWAMWLEEHHLLSRAADALGAERVFLWLKERDETAQLFLSKHLDFAAAEPDAITRLVLEAHPSDDIGRQAQVEFYNSLGVVTGPFHRGLERQLERARTWFVVVKGGSAEAWAAALVKSLEEQIPVERRRDEERALRLP